MGVNGTNEEATAAVTGAPEAGPLVADCAVDAAGVFTVELDLPGGIAEGTARVLLRSRPRTGEQATDVTLETTPVPGRPGRVRARLPVEPVLAEGRWEVRLSCGGPALPVAAGVRDLRALVDRTPPASAGPLAVRVPYAGQEDRLMLRVWRREGHVEAGGLRLADGALTVRARLVGVAPEPGARVLLRRRGKGGPQHVVEPRTDADGGIVFTVELAALLEEEPPRAAYWDLFWLPSPTAPGIRISRLLDDVAERKRVFVYPHTRVAGHRVFPYYTVDNDLSIEVNAPAG
ncbi:MULTISPECIES: hypothetical protein [unclassified Streptomyces]|uniref:hypothetical protein n=1 Tax=unclassified Streptomyces TaxID=2593676 RepID=UPI001F1BE092|nr:MULTISPECIES: hypothetical protein [unclassified Streptomyces]MCU4748918.1 hypothetical protein [Streptomyces sp. G-5]